ncbi:hypothetical protein [Kitasatospora sp. NPDC057541]|uniref:hypothetical protein n=1 Tax=unclassified Kitasatospora TaxID=2633591 RepID=UPI0036D0B232
MATFVLIPGALHGGWWYRPITEGLRAAGHEAFVFGDKVAVGPWTIDTSGLLTYA